MIVMIIVFGIILIGISIYLLIYYSHKDDSGSATALVCKIVVVGLLLLI
jgi:hypothetical protein